MSNGTLASPLPAIRARTFNKEVMYSGLAHATVGQPLDVYIQDLMFRFSFIDEGATRIETNVIGSKSLEFKLFSFTSPLGTGFTEPFFLGQIGGRNTYIMLTVIGVGSSGVKVVFCTFLQDYPAPHPSHFPSVPIAPSA
jgi:hypothetical protein